MKHQVKHQNKLQMKYGSGALRRGFSLIECGALVLVLSMIGMTVAPVLRESQSSMRGATSAANLRSIGQSAGAYGFSNQGRLFSYSWRGGVPYMMPDGRIQIDQYDTSAAMRQNQEILQRLTGRIYGRSKIHLLSHMLPHQRYNHLVLMDYLNEPLESTRYIDPADANELSWHANPLEYLEFPNSLPYGGDHDTTGYDHTQEWSYTDILQRWTFASSYQVVPSAWQFDFPSDRYIPHAVTPHFFYASGPGIDLHTGRNIAEVAYPAQKVWMHEEFDREQAGSPYFGYDQARAEKLMFDLSVNNWASGAANPSVVPEYGLHPWVQSYIPLDTFPIPLGGLGDASLLSQRYRWTFRGLAGVDYGPTLLPKGP